MTTPDVAAEPIGSDAATKLALAAAATQYTIPSIPAGHPLHDQLGAEEASMWDLTIEWRGDDRWAISRHAQVWTRSHQWVPAYSIDVHDPDELREARWTLDEAAGEVPRAAADVLARVERLAARG